MALQLVWYDIVWHCHWYGMAWYGTAIGMVWHGMVLPLVEPISSLTGIALLSS